MGLMNDGVCSMTTLPEAINKEIGRLQEHLKLYEEIGPAGAFGKLMLQNAIREGESALLSGEATEMVVALKHLRECE